MSVRPMITRRAYLRGLGVAGLVLATAACGFSPMYGGGAYNSQVAEELGSIEVGIARDRVGQILTTNIERQVAAAARDVPKVYRLDFTSNLYSTEIGIQKDATATRANITYVVSYKLFRDGERVYSGSGTSIASYNILDDQYAAVVSREDAERRAAEDVAQQVVNGLSLWFKRRAER